MQKALLIDLFSLPQYDLSLALGYLKAASDADEAVSAHWEIELKHMPATAEPEEVVAAIVRSDASLVGFSCYSWNIAAVERTLAKMPPDKEYAVVLGGVEVTPDPMAVLRRNRCADAVVFGEGEETFRTLLASLPGGPKDFTEKTADSIKGLCWRVGKTVKQNPERPPIEDLSKVPSPYLAGSFRDALKGRTRVMVETARGCVFRCAYCFESRGFSKLRVFPIDRVRQEVDKLLAAGVTEIVFLDTNFNCDRERALEILEYLRTRPKRARYAFELRAERMDADLCKAVGALDFFAEIGLQSTNPRALEAVNRTFERQKFEAGLVGLLNASIYRPCSFSAGGGVAVDVMVGLPNDGISDVMAAFDYVASLAPSRIELSMTKVIPGTALFDDAKKYRYKTDTAAQYQVLSTRTMPKQDIEAALQFREAVDFAYNRVHAVRTICWAAVELKTKPSALFMDLARRIAKSKVQARDLNVKDLAGLLEEISESRGSVRVADSIGSKLTAEGFFNVLQKWKEKRRSLWTRFLFKAGHAFLSLIWGLAPLPFPSPLAQIAVQRKPGEPELQDEEEPEDE